jgi:hypothetical protein
MILIYFNFSKKNFFCLQVCSRIFEKISFLKQEISFFSFFSKRRFDDLIQFLGKPIKTQPFCGQKFL